jgi:hypothetical protein
MPPDRTAKAIMVSQETKTPGQIAYEADCAIEPLYSDGTPRKTWAQLGELKQSTWEKLPTVRATKR